MRIKTIDSKSAPPRQTAADEADVPLDALSRRNFLSLMGASLALAGIGGCSVKPAPTGEIVPYSHPSSEIEPGKPLFYATTMTFAGSAVGLLAESHEGRPTKIEGNPNHPASLGATDIFHQASVLALYDPDRAKTVTYGGQARTWDDAIAEMKKAILKLREKGGAGLRLLTKSVVSPTLARQLNALFNDLPDAKWHVYEPIHKDSAVQAAEWAFGKKVNPIYDFSKADVVLSLDADFLQCGPGNLRYAADFMARRRVRTAGKDAAGAEMNRLYVAETSVSCTGAKADHRLALRAKEIANLAIKMAIEVGVLDRGLPLGKAGVPHEKWIAAVAKDLVQHRGRCLVLAGDRQPPEVHLLAHAMNDHLGNIGQTVGYIAPIDARPESRMQSLRELAEDVGRGRVEFLMIFGGNPVFTAPAELDFAERLKSVPLSMHHGLFANETTYLCHWHLPETHFLEAWSDGRAFDGTASLAQPLIEPLYRGRSAHEVIALLANLRETPGREIVREYWKNYWEEQHEEGRFEQFWEKALHDGIVANTAFEKESVKLKEDWRDHISPKAAMLPFLSNQTAIEPYPNYEIVFQPDPTIYDGSWVNNGWLQELPKPSSKLAWGNAAIMSPATAKQLDIERGKYAHGGEHGGFYMPMVELQFEGRKVLAPTWIMPGHADGSVSVYLGHGGKADQFGEKNRKTGFNAYLLRTADKPWFGSGLSMKKTGESELVACTQANASMEDREPVRSATLAEYREEPNFAAAREARKNPDIASAAAESLTMYESFDYSPPKQRWGMAIDLTACIGCHACVVACQAENNIPIVGKEQVACGRSMHWLRIDRYADGPADRPTNYHFQPVPCMHCENAPCEYVCPVEATVHSAEGLNDMVYQRCVGTRFCSNNCPYKVRRFNFFLYSDYQTPARRLQYNPDVTVRSRGVMEKCSYCVQRIRRAEIDAQMENRLVADGDILTACQAACPTRAIVFGDLNDPQSTVKKWKDSPLNYALLGDLNTHPRTTYLAELRNPNSEIEI